MTKETIKLTDLKPAEGSTSRGKRVGRGRASGMGKTSTRGHNGEGQRSGRSSKRGFEGGQMPSYRQLPKLKGFQIINKLNYAEINVGRIDDIVKKYKLKEISLTSLLDIKKIHPSSDGLRVLGNGDIKSAIAVKAAYVSPSAKSKIEASGGSVEIV